MKFLLWAFLACGVTAAFGADSVEPAVPQEPLVPAKGPAVQPAADSPTAHAEMTSLPHIAPGPDGKVKFYVIPIRDEIAPPVLYIVRSGVKDAIAAHADCVVLDMDTPGGRLDVTLEIMQILAKFEGTTVTYVNTDAVSAGSFISAATDRIYFAPSGVIGAAAPVSEGGQDIDKTMKQKVVSYLRARVRAISENHPYRGDVVSAMMDENFELKIDGEVIKPKGELLSLTAHEAMRGYGDPPQPLLGAGIEEDLPALYHVLAGPADFTVRKFEMSWSLDLALWLNRLSPLLLAVGGLLLFIEFKTPGFGVFGISGIALLALVFFGHNVAGLSGHEPLLFFLLGVALVFLELLVFPGVLILAGLGGLIILGSLLWGMADIWPGNVQDITPGTFVGPAFTLSLGFLIGIVFFLIVLRFLPKTSMWNRMVLSANIYGTASGAARDSGAQEGGGIGVVVSPLRPTGTIELGGRRYEARSELGEIGVGVQVRIVRRSDFVVIVEPVPQ